MLTLAAPEPLACGGRWPTQHPAADASDPLRSRRVDFLFFVPDELPDPGAEAVYDGERYRRDYLGLYDLEVVPPSAGSARQGARDGAPFLDVCPLRHLAG